MGFLSHEKRSQYWQEYEKETGAIVFICHISTPPCLYCGGVYMHCVLRHRPNFPKMPQTSRRPGVTFINWLRLSKQQSHRSTESDTPPLVTSLKSHANSRGGCVSLSLTNTNRCAFCDPVSVSERQLLCEIQCVSADVFIGGRAAHLSFFDLFPPATVCRTLRLA